MILPKISLLIIFVIIWSGWLPAQENKLEESLYPPHKITLYGSFGNYYLYGILSVNIEGKVWQSTKMWKKSIWVKASASRWLSYLSYEAGGPAYLLGGVFLTGKSNHFIEANLGATYLYNRVGYNAMLSEYEYDQDHDPNFPPYRNEPQKSDYILILPAGSLGYRYQPSKGHFLFRAGIGFPDAFYISVGFSI